MATNPVDGWRKFAIEKLEASRLVTDYRGLSEGEIPFEEFPNYGVFECNPDTKLNPNHYLISGTEPQIILQSSLIKALYQMLGHQLGYTIDFDLWFKDFELEFKLDPITGASRIPIVTDQEIAEFTFWGRSKDERPKFEYLDVKTNADRKKKARGEPSTLGYRVIKFWKNRKQLESFDILAGTPTELRSQIFYLMYGGGSSEIVEEYDDKTPTEISTLSNRPHIRLYFRQPADQVARGRRGAKMNITINVMDKTDLTINKSDLVEWAARITEQFNPGGNPFIYRKGKNYYTYHDWANGYHLQLLANTETEARQILLKVLAIKQHIINEKYWKESRAVNVAAAYPNIEETVQIMGETYIKPLQRPSANVEFRWAKLFLPSIGKQFILVSNEKRMLVSAEVMNV